MKKFATLLLALALLLCSCAPFDHDETTTPEAEEVNPPAGDNTPEDENDPTDEKNPTDEKDPSDLGDSPTSDLPFEGGVDPNGWT